VFVSIKIFKKNKKNMLSVGLEPKQFVSEEYCQDALASSATSGCANNNPFATSIRGSRASKPHA
jgi:hypothetical protein